MDLNFLFYAFQFYNSTIYKFRYYFVGTVSPVRRAVWQNGGSPCKRSNCFEANRSLSPFSQRPPRQNARRPPERHRRAGASAPSAVMAFYL
jgi:hypothetical protein